MTSSPEHYVHELGLCESDHVGRGTRIWAFAHVMAGARLGSDCNIGDHAFIEGGVQIGDRVTVKNGVQIYLGVTIEDDVFLGPNVVFTNVLRPRAAFKEPPERFLQTRVCRGATIGANATILCGVELRAQSFVGAGSVVGRDVPAHALVVGSPARPIGWVCACGERLDSELRCRCGSTHRLLSDWAGLEAT